MKSIINKSKTACSPAWPLDMGAKLSLVTQRKTFFLFFILCLCVYNRILLYSPCWPQTWDSCLSLPVVKLQACATNHTLGKRNRLIWKSVSFCVALRRVTEMDQLHTCHLVHLSPQNAHHAHRDPVLPSTKSFSVRSYRFGCWEPSLPPHFSSLAVLA